MNIPGKPAGKSAGKSKDKAGKQVPASLPLPENLARIAANAHAVVNAVDGILRSGGAQVGLADWVLLRRLAAQPEAQPMGRIARQMGVTRQRIQKQVDRLAAEGLLEVQAVEGDKRSRSMAVTRAGHERLAEVGRLWAQKLSHSGELASAKNLDGLRQRFGQVASLLIKFGGGEAKAANEAKRAAEGGAAA